MAAAAASQRGRPAARLLLGPLLLLVLAGIPAARAISDSDYRALTQSVTKLQRAEWFGSYDLLWGQGTAIALDTDGRPIVTATKYGAGRIVHFASDGLSELSFSVICCTGNGLPRLFFNAVKWAARRGSGGQQLRIAGSHWWLARTVVDSVLSTDPDSFINAGTYEPKDVAADSSMDVYLVNGNVGYNDVGDYAAALLAYVKAGGGVVIASQGSTWGDRAPLASHPSNKFLIPAGIVLSSKPVQASAPINAGTTMPLNTQNCDVALECLFDTCSGNTNSDCYAANQTQVNRLRDACLAVDNFLPRNAPYRSMVGQLAAAVSGQPGAACSAIRRLRGELPAPAPSPSPPGSTPVTRTPGLKYRLLASDSPYPDWPYLWSRPSEVGRVQDVSFACGNKCISAKYKNNVVVRLSGRFLISAAMLRGPVFFSITASGPTRLYINGVLVPSMQTDAATSGNVLTRTAGLALPKSGSLPIALDFMQAGGASTLKLRWRPPTQYKWSPMPLFTV